MARGCAKAPLKSEANNPCDHEFLFSKVKIIKKGKYMKLAQTLVIFGLLIVADSAVTLVMIKSQLAQEHGDISSIQFE